MSRKEFLFGHLSPEVGRFVLQGLRQLEQENVFDAPSVISGIVCRMRSADSALVRSAANRTEGLLRQMFAQQYLTRVGA
ncbi:MAG: hypothetical protein ACOY94_00365 [Bacillota bacterium]